MRSRRLWLEIGFIIAGIALLAAWMRPRAGERSREPAHENTDGLRLVGTNAQGFDEYENLKDGSVLIRIPGGRFIMGSDEGEADEKPIHSVHLDPYFMARGPVSENQYARFESETGRLDTLDRKAHNQNWSKTGPVSPVGWVDAAAYAEWAGLRLPTEEEWEYAARGPQSLVYPWGNEWDRFKKNEDSPFGCHAMGRGFMQWTASWYDRYPGNPTSNGDFGRKYRVVRGGSYDYHKGEAWILRGALRFKRSEPAWEVGFRCARSI